MHRLEWKIAHDGTLNAQHEGWAFEIIFQTVHGTWLLCVQPIPARGPDWRKWFERQYLQDAMAIAEAIVSGANLS